MKRVLTSLVAALLIIAGSGPVFSEDKFEFSPKIAPVDDIRFAATLSPDKEAVTVIFDNLAVALQELKGAPPVASRFFSLTLPTKGDGKSTEIVLQVRGHAQTHQGASAVLLVRTFGASNLAEFPAGSDSDYDKEIKLSVPAGRTIPLTLGLLVERDGSAETAAALLTVDSIDIAIPITTGAPH